MIIRKIIILTVLGGQGIFIASLLLLIFFSCITQLEAREEREEVENWRGKRDRGKRDRWAPGYRSGEDVEGRIPDACVRLSTRQTKTGRKGDKTRACICVFVCASVCLYLVRRRNRNTVSTKHDSGRRSLQATRGTQWPQLWEPLTERKQGDIWHRQRRHKNCADTVNRDKAVWNLLCTRFSAWALVLGSESPFLCRRKPYYRWI